MLVIKRKSGEGFIIETNEGQIIEINVKIDNRNSKDIKVSIEAPQDFTILRNELLEFEKVSEDIRNSILGE